MARVKPSVESCVETIGSILRTIESDESSLPLPRGTVQVIVGPFEELRRSLQVNRDVQAVPDGWEKQQQDKIDSVLKRVNELRFSRATALETS